MKGIPVVKLSSNPANANTGKSTYSSICLIQCVILVSNPYHNISVLTYYKIGLDHICVGIGIIGYCCLFLQGAPHSLALRRNPLRIRHHPTLKIMKGVIRPQADTPWKKHCLCFGTDFFCSLQRHRKWRNKPQNRLNPLPPEHQMKMLHSQASGWGLVIALVSVSSRWLRTMLLCGRKITIVHTRLSDGWWIYLGKAWLVELTPDLEQKAKT